MVPEGWQHRSLGEVTELQRGFDLPKSQRELGDIPIVSSGGYSGWHSVAKVERTGIVTGRYGSIGEVFFVEGHHWPLNTTLWVKDFHGNDLRWAYYLLQTIDYAKFSDKTGVPGINRNDIHRIGVGVPPLAEQRKIADILSTWDQAIEKTEALLSNARTQKRALMQQLLTGKRRFAEFEGQPWKEMELGDVVSGIKGGGTPDKSNASFWEGEVPWVSVKDLKANVINTTIDTISEAGLQQSASNAFEEGTVVVATRMAVGVTVKLGCRMAINQDLKAILPSKKLNNDFLYHFMKMSTDKLAALGTGSTVKGIKLLDLRRLPIWLPPSLEEQCRVVAVLEDVDAEVETHTFDLNKLRIEKKALMQQLLTGKRRVAV